MSDYDYYNRDRFGEGDLGETEVVVAELAPEPATPEVRVWQSPRRRFWLPLGLFVATCLSTLLAGGYQAGIFGFVQYVQIGGGLREALIHGLMYALPLMTILVCHEAGHFIQAHRYGVHASYPYFIPLPISPLGTLGAVIGMQGRMGDRRALFDIGITGPLAGLVPTLIFCVVGLHWSSIEVGQDQYGDPLLFKQIVIWLKGPIPPGYVIHVHPMAFAGWVGLLVTSLNLLPIGQLDGGHILYGLLRKEAHLIARFLLLAAIAVVIWFWAELWVWTLMLVLLTVMGPAHPPTADDDVPLGAVRIVLGWLTLAFILIGFTPTPLITG